MFYPASKIMVSINRGLVYGSIYQQLTESVHTGPIKEYLCRKFGWNNDQFNSIDWGAMEAYTSTLEPCKETNVIKLVINWQNDNHQNGLFYEKKVDICPACELVKEDHMHFLSCTDPILRGANRPAWNKVGATIKRLRTTVIIAKAFNNILEALMSGDDPEPPEFPNTEIGNMAKQAWEEQQHIGWIHTAQGRLSKKWGVALLKTGFLTTV